jgi:5-methylcytosine-specific restriction endonuclease McrA
METKECNKCFIIKSMDQFHKDKGNKDGRKNYCKACYKEKIYSYGETEGKEKRKPYTPVTKGETKENRKPYIRKGRNPKQLPKPTIIKNGVEGKECTECETWKPFAEYHRFARMHDGREIYCKECRKKKLSDYFQTDKGKNNAHRASSKRRSRMKQAKYIPYDRVALLRRDKYTCQSCGIKVHDRSTGNWNTPDKAHLDHIVSLENGGETREENLQVLCRTCNLSKSGQNKGEAQMTLF